MPAAKRSRGLPPATTVEERPSHPHKREGTIPTESANTYEYEIERLELDEGVWLETRRPRHQLGPNQWFPGQPHESTGKNQGIGEKSGP